MRNRNYLSDAMVIALRQLKETCLDVQQHQIVWASNLHHFHIEHIPPIKIPQNFNTSQLRPEVLSKINRAELRMKLVWIIFILKKYLKLFMGFFLKRP